MSDIEERRIGDVVVRIDRLICVGFGDCIDEAADAFELDDDGIAVFRDGADQTEHGRIRAACEACPVDAISLHGPDGERIG